MSAVTGFSVGKDVSITVTTATGNLTIPGLTSFTSKSMKTGIKSKRLDGKTYFANIPDGWEGSFKLDRTDPSIDIYFAAMEAAYLAGTSNATGTIQEVISEANGQVTTWQYSGVVLNLDDAGDWKGDARVEQTISFNATTKTQVS